MKRSLPLLVAVLPVAVPLLFAGDVVINEIHFQPVDKTVPEEFVELYNNGDTAVDISGWFFSGGIDYTVPPGTVLDPGGYLVVAQDPEVLESLYGPLPVVGPFRGRLENDGEELVLRNAAGGRELS